MNQNKIKKTNFKKKKIVKKLRRENRKRVLLEDQAFPNSLLESSLQTVSSCQSMSMSPASSTAESPTLSQVSASLSPSLLKQNNVSSVEAVKIADLSTSLVSSAGSPPETPVKVDLLQKTAKTSTPLRVPYPTKVNTEVERSDLPVRSIFPKPYILYMKPITPDNVKCGECWITHKSNLVKIKPQWNAFF